MGIIRKPKGVIRVITRHRSPKGIVFHIGKEFEYFDIIERKTCKCPHKKRKTLYSLYKTKKGLIPIIKAEII